MSVLLSFLRFSLPVLFLAALLTRPLDSPVAQTVQEGIQEGDKQTQQRERTLQRLDKILKDEKLEKAKGFQLPLVEMYDDKTELPRPGEGPKIPVKRFEVSESNILSEGEIREIVAPFEGRALFLAELYELIEVFNQVYRKKGFVTARAVLPPQTIEDGVVKVQLIEGVIGKIQINGNKYVSDFYIRSRLGLGRGDIVELGKLEKWLTRYNRLNPSRLAVKLKPGEKFGDTDLVVDVDEAKQYSLNVFRDRHGVVATGENRHGAIFRVGSLLGVEDSFSAGVTETWGRNDFQKVDGKQGSMSGYLTYSIPLTKYGTRFAATASQGRTQIIGGSFSSLEISGTSNQVNYALTHPLIADEKLKLEVDAMLDGNRSTTTIGTLRQFTKIRKPSVGLSMEYIGDTGYYAMSLRRANVHSRVRDNTTRTIGDHWKTTGTGFAYQTLGGGFSLQSSLSFQLSGNKPIPTGEQFGIGGQGSVRAYEAAVLSGDEGYFVNLELQYATQVPYLTFAYQENPVTLQAYAFYDHGGAFPYRSNGDRIRREDFANAAGLGVRVGDIAGFGTLGVAYSWSLDRLHRERIKKPRWQIEFSLDF